MSARSHQSRLTPAKLRPLRNRLRQSVRDAGLTDLSPTGQTTQKPFWELEPSPVIIDPEEWDSLNQAIQQRARLTNAFLRDLYSQQDALREGIIPPEFTLADPYYRRACLNLEPHRTAPASLIRFDLIKTAEGWQFTDTHTNTPVGLSYAIQNRRFLTQEAGDFYRALPDYHSIINAPLELVDTLRELAPQKSRRPSMVFLTTGPRYPFYSEHSFLARKMGLRLAQGDDLLVSDNQVYFKTIAGLERVDVIYRRVNDTHIDPAVFNTDFETAGIPGLIQCIRAGNVIVANAIGSGTAENRALHAYLPALSRYYLGERLQLPSIPTLLCNDNDQVDSILEKADHFELLPTHSPRVGTHQENPPTLRTKRLPKIVRENAAHYVARPKLKFLSPPSTSRGQDEFRLSVYALTRGDHVSVIPGGIVNVGAPPYPRDRVGKCADVIVLTNHRSDSGSLADLEPDQEPVSPERTVPSSRAVHALFWLGRYLERAETTARMLAILDDVSLEEIPAQDRQRWLPLWRGLLNATGHTDHKIDGRAPPASTLTGDLIWRMSLDRSHPSSLLNTVSSATSNARELREYISPEAGRILTGIDQKLADFARQSPTSRSRPAREKRNELATRALHFVHTEINACLASTARTMLQDAGWHFLEIGKQIERATFTADTLLHVLTGSPTVTAIRTRSDSSTFRDNPELSALLRMLGSQDAYRRLYRRRSQPLLVAQLLIQQTRAPRSILHNLREISQNLQGIHESGESNHSTPLQNELFNRIAKLTTLNLAPFFEQDSAAQNEMGLEGVLAEIVESIGTLHQLFEDHYFSHQARFDDEHDQSEFGL
ncbi:circularly permuted type 2 ATP-grasp protein [Opitutaceae bacterium]|nr:circularly permuted type 2 ATP-grasp protein [Opitutaceae bacterium]MDB4474556.1 circularly permuted type 2 ATP-grasp protein [Opitutaceae bacterium]